MTRSNSPLLKNHRSSARLTKRRQESSPIKKPNKNLKRIHTIHDFRYSKNDKTYYQVQYVDGTDEWQSAEALEESLVLNFQENVQQKIGFSIPDQKYTCSSQKFLRPRVAKSRAFFQLKSVFDDGHADSDASDGTESDQDDIPFSKRKRSRSNNSNSTVVATQGKRSRKGTKHDLKLQARRKRQQQREPITIDLSKLTPNSDDHIHCCLRCSIRSYRQALVVRGNNDRHDTASLVKVMDDTTRTPWWSREDIHFDTDSVLQMALLERTMDHVALLTKPEPTNHVTVPPKFTQYNDENTRANLNSHGFQNAIRKVNESRGNRQGNSAFYREPVPDPMVVEYRRRRPRQNEMTILSTLTYTQLTTQPHVIDTLYLAKCNGLIGLDLIYYAVASGNHLLAAKIVEDHTHTTWFNHLHINALKFVNGEALEPYRRNQIMKTAKETKRLTPLACSAINPSDQYLKELYEAVDEMEKYATDDLGRTIAHFAAASSTSLCIEYLVQQDYKGLNTSDTFQVTPLIQAARYGRHANIRPLLLYLSNNELPSASHADHTLLKTKSRPLHYAAAYGHPLTCQALVECGATVDVYDALDRSTPLMLAAHRGHLEAVRCLVEKGADPEAVDKYGRTPLHLASMQGHLEIVHYLLKLGVDSDCKDSSYNRPAHYAAAFGWLPVMQLLVELGQVDLCAYNVWRSSPLSVANLKGHFSVVSYILSSDTGGSNTHVNFKDANGKTMLHHCLANEINMAIDIEQNLRLLTLLLENGADTNVVTNKGESPLHLLAQCYQFTSYEPIGYGPASNPEHKKLDDQDGLNYQVTVANLLHQYGADINILDNTERSPFSYAMQHHNDALVEWFIQHNVSYWNQVAVKGYNFFHYCFRAAVTADNASKPGQSSELVMIRAERLKKALNQVWDAIKKRATSSADVHENSLVNAVNAENLSPIMYGVKTALATNNQNDEDYEFFFSTFDFLVTHFNLDPKLALKDGQCLHQAARLLNRPMFLYLLRKGCDANQLNDNDDKWPVFALTQPLTWEQRYYYYGNKMTADDVKRTRFEFVQSVLPNWLDSGGDFTVTSSTGTTLLMEAVRFGDVKVLTLLLDAIRTTQNNRLGISLQETVNMTSITQKTALGVLIESFPKCANDTTDYDSLTTLLEAGANINHIYSARNSSLFMKVVSLANTRLLGIVFEKSTYNIDHFVENDIGMTSLLLATRSNSMKVFGAYFDQLVKDCSPGDISDLINGKSTKINSHVCLSAPVKDNQLGMVKRLLKYGADPNITGTNDKSHLLQAVVGEFYDIVACLLEAGVNPNHHRHYDDYDNSPLHLAIQKENVDIIKLLLDAGADINAVNKRLQTPFHYAIRKTMQHQTRAFRIERLLLKAGKIDINATDMLGRTPLHYAFIKDSDIPVMHRTDQHKARLTLLEQQRQQNQTKHDIKTNIKNSALAYNAKRTEYINKCGTIALEWFILAYDKEHKFTANDKNISDTMTNDSTTNDSENSDELMLSSDEELELQPYDKFTMWETDYEIHDQSDPIDVIKFLSSISGILYDVLDIFGRIPLHYAATLGAFTCTTFFLDKNADVNSMDLDKNTPLHLALLYKRIDYAVMLCNCGASTDDMTLRSGLKKSIFAYSLSESYMNMVYLTLGRGTDVIEGLQLVLETGNYYLASILFQSADSETLLSITTATRRTFWHLISNFIPSNSDVWKEYLPIFIERLTDLNLGITTDNHGQTAIHYAAKSNQLLILEHLLSRPGCPLNIMDVEGYSELWYAVSSKSLEAVKILLAHGATIDNASRLERNPSIISHAVSLGLTDVVRLLLDNGCSLNQDAVFDRPTPLMLAICNGNVSLVKVLISYGADVNQKSRFTCKTDDLIGHPLVAASIYSSDSILVLLEAGADANAPGPTYFGKTNNNKLGYTQYSTVFSMNLGLGNKANIKLLLDANVDLNLPYNNSDRTLFTHIFYTYCYGGSSNNRSIYPEIYRWIYDMYRENDTGKQLLVNLIDDATGMTLMEAAIRRDNLDLLNNLLRLGADPHVQSCQRTMLSSGTTTYQEPLNALFHCIMHENYDALKAIYSHTTSISWDQQDSHGRTIICCLITKSYPYVPNVSEVLKDLAKAIGTNYRDVFCIPDKEGFTAAEYAFAGGCDEVKQVFVYLGLGDPQHEPSISHYFTYHSIQLDHISLQTVESDAEAERDVLQAKKNALKLQLDKDATIIENVPVDPLSGLESVGNVVYENDEAYDTMIMKIDVTQSTHGCNMFYKMSVIYNRLLDLYVLWTRWGTFGEDGWHQKTPYQNMADATTEFKSIFRAKTGNDWNDRKTNFVSKPGKFDLIKAMPTKDSIVKPSDFEVAQGKVPSILSRSVLQMMQVFCSFDDLKLGYRSLQMELPIGQIPQKSIEQAMTILKTLEPLVDRYVSMGSTMTTTKKQAVRKQIIHEIGQETNAYYRLLPRPSDFNNGGITPILDKHTLKMEMARLLEIGYVNFSANVLLAAKYRSAEIHHLEYTYRSLGCHLTEINNTGREFDMINQYIQSTSVNCKDKYEITTLLAAHRHGEEDRYKIFENNPNRKLLWHGTRMDNYMGILNQGLLCKPSRAQYSGSMFGDGIYFADMFCKSVNYCSSAKRPAYAALLLCEVALGNECVMESYTPSSYQPKEKGHLSVKGQGKWAADRKHTIYDNSGVQIPLGPAQVQSGTKYSKLNFNEYIVYNPAQVKIRYLVLVRNKTLCNICERRKAVGALEAFSFDIDTFECDMNEYDYEMAWAYVIHKGCKLQDIYNDGLDEYIGSSDFSSKYEFIDNSFTRESSVCQCCANDVMDSIWKIDITRNIESLPDELRSRPLCPDHDKCKTQYGNSQKTEVILHNQKYRHW